MKKKTVLFGLEEFCQIWGMLKYADKKLLLNGKRISIPLEKKEKKPPRYKQRLIIETFLLVKKFFPEISSQKIWILTALILVWLLNLVSCEEIMYVRRKKNNYARKITNEQASKVITGVILRLRELFEKGENIFWLSPEKFVQEKHAILQISKQS